MIAPRAPLPLTHLPIPKVRDFAILSGLEAGIRGTLMSVMPLVIYRAFGDAATVSQIYLAVGAVSLVFGLLVPWLAAKLSRRWMYTFGTVLYMSGIALAILDQPQVMPFALGCLSLATVTIAVCLNAYVLDYVSRTNLGKSESLRLVFSGPSWAAGPLVGVWLLNWWTPAPFMLAGCFAVAQMAMFWRLRLGNGKQISRARAPSPSPVAFLGRFFAQPRLLAGWMFAVIRSCGWWVYVVYLPIYCVENGLPDTVGAAALSAANLSLFVAPAMLVLVRRLGVRLSVSGAFFIGGVLFVAGWGLSDQPWLVVLALYGGSVTLIMLDVCGGLPFLMAVKPSERTEMSAVYASYRDVSGILTPAGAALVLLVMPLAGIFAVCGAAMLGMGVLARGLHPRLGVPRVSPADAVR
ncbi:Major Facilitator Superfamily protein [Sulfitobacter brevis]|uniref:Major Facilitator Superfamily protein n=1 Tax=Sulfitobacter brevis TaxID=74348 RepID=A0A1I2DKA1_9RHOB|nr:MFS transporter [Sulfitobacter brevis]SFE80693.1 Major Facilitator Superfamily protein [Sulfitobacter brevis]